jgi:hypothetical protein
MDKNDLTKILEKKVDRKQFLAYLGAGFLSIVGVGGVIKTLLDIDSKPQGSLYGRAKYGNNKKANKVF